MKKTIVITSVSPTPRALREDIPFFTPWAASAKPVAVGPRRPDSTGAAQASYLIGKWHPAQWVVTKEVEAIFLSKQNLASLARPVHVNRVLREHGYLSVQKSNGRERLHAATSQAFALVDHRLAHVYVNDLAKLDAVRQLLEQVPGVAKVLGTDEKATHHLNHPRAGELILLAAPNTWFSSCYWLDDTHAPALARSMDRHGHLSYDPAKLFTASSIKFLLQKVGLDALGNQLGLRMLLNLIALDATLVKGVVGEG